MSLRTANFPTATFLAEHREHGTCVGVIAGSAVHSLPLGGPASTARFDTVAATHAAMTDVRVGVQEAHIGTTVSPAFSAGKAFKTAVQTAYFGKEANGSNETEEP